MNKDKLSDLEERILGLINDKEYKPMGIGKLAAIFSNTEDDFEDFHQIIKQLEGSGQIFINKKGKVGSLEHYGMKKGIYRGTKSEFGFVEFEDKEIKDTFIHGEDRLGAFDGDTVLVKITKEENGFKKPEGVIVRILSRNTTEVVGLFEESKNFAFVIADNAKFDKDIFIAKKYFSGAKNNDKVLCRITKWPDEARRPEGKIIQIIGQKGDRYVEIDSIVKSHGLSDKFPVKVEKTLKDIPECVDSEDIKDRVDLRSNQTYTIDGDDSKDFDDAIEVKKVGQDYELGVHIADVTHYVRENSKLDKEALSRATSVYMVDKVVPMLPQKLSNGICSLNPNVDRLTLSCIMKIDGKSGKVKDYKIQKTVINSKARMTYKEINSILEKDDENMKKKYSDFLVSIYDARDLAEVLRKRRFKRGAIDFDFVESKIKLDDTGVPISIDPYERGLSNKMIEEFMLLANETVAEHFFWMKLPFVYRVHEDPDDEKILTLRNFVNELGYKMPISRDGVKPSDLQRLLESLDTKEAQRSIGTIMLRTLRQARYSPECLGHFGLAAKFYCHFTSPIRRYPDLQIHRIIKDQIDGKMDEKRINHYNMILDDVSTQSSKQEREAVLAEREVDSYYKAIYMCNFIGETYHAYISGITSFGIFAELENGVEGLIRLQLLDDYFEYNQSSMTLVGKDTGKVYKLGQKINIRVENVNIDAREIDFKIEEEI
ncbi:ribonuclease R [Peptostreptococcus equinus]|uniref:Ribonuclease R n=1 Tax=Peptostreptococcus equinus TaxID=3003601 RepID=A0ABY7JNI1_9FIRM|nr:ribonuclease R [Peptostreptococcus sp. CBA3647]WAW14421.1 ribonuclease R [Peptostreptococcus sp. CBA3647]